MTKIRVHELAKQIGKTNKEVIEELNKMGVEVKNHLSSVYKKDISHLMKDEANKKTKTAVQSTKAAPLKKREAVSKRVEADKKINKVGKPKEVEKKSIDDKQVKDKKVQGRAEAGEGRRKNYGAQTFGANVGNQRRQGGARRGGSPFIRSASSGKRLIDQNIRPEPKRPEPGDNIIPSKAYKYNKQNRDSQQRGQKPPYNKDRRPPFKREIAASGQNDRRPYGNRANNQGGRPFNKDARGQDKNFKDRRPARPVDDKESIVNTIKASRKTENKKPTNKRYDKRKPKRQENHAGLQKLKKVITKKDEKKVTTISTVSIPEVIALQDFAKMIKIAPAQLVKKLFLDGKVYTLNDMLSFEVAEEIALEYNIICEKEIKIDIIEELLKEEKEKEENLQERSPVVCVMGHVDHGKTSLLDAIRQSNDVSNESGGITQHIGASQIFKNDKFITFLDTPGHEAFTSMRLRGAKATDIAILVVAADDGVMPQTIEAINHAKAANIEIIVAINKIDKPAANPDRVKSDLSEQGVLVSDWGGDVDCVEVSAHTRQGIDELLDMILLTAEVLDLKANPNRNARGVVLEAKMDAKKGKVATLLVQKGTLKVGDCIAAGTSSGKVRTMMYSGGIKAHYADPSTPVEITGLNEVPKAGEIFVVTDTDKEARQFAETYLEDQKNQKIEATKGRMSLDDLFEQIKEGELKELNVIVKADVQGSVEAIRESLEKLSNEEVLVKVIHGGVGAVTESDAILASASNAIIIGFNVRVDAVATTIISSEKIDCRTYSVIYNAIEDVQSAMKGMLDPVFEEKVVGKALVRQTYKASGVGVIAGCFVDSGIITRKSKIRVYRQEKVIFDGDMASLKRFKDDVKEVAKGFECGIVISDFEDIQVDDVFEAYEMVEVPR